MNLLTLAFTNIKRRKLEISLNSLLLATGIATIVFLMLAIAQVRHRLQQDAQGIDLVLGAKGSPIQLILSSIYHSDIPTGNIDYQAFKQWAKHPQIKQAIPLSLGDSWRNHRIVGTTHDYPKHYQAQLAAGEYWKDAMEVIIGADVAAAGLALGQHFSSVHGLSQGQHEHQETYEVVGILAPSDTVLDRLILTSLESVWEIHTHESHHHEGEHEETHEEVVDEINSHDGTHSEHSGEHGQDAHHENEEHGDFHEHEAHEESSAHDADQGKEITSLLLSYTSPLAGTVLPLSLIHI